MSIVPATPPTYSFNSIDFNGKFYEQSSSSISGASLTQAYEVFLKKSGTDTATGPITFSNNINMKAGINLIGSASNDSINFVDSGGSQIASINCGSGSVSCNTGTLTGGFNISTSSGTLLNALSTGLTLGVPLACTYSTVPTLTTTNIGFSYNSTTNSSYIYSASGSNTIYNSTNQTPLSIGVYLFSANFQMGLASFTGSITSGAGFQVGYCLGTSSTPSSNTKQSLYNGISNISFSNNSTTYPYSVNGVVNVTVDGSYLTPFFTLNLSALTSGSIQSNIPYYSVVRIA